MTSTRVCIKRNFSSDWGDMCITQHSLPPQNLNFGLACLAKLAPKFKIVVAMNAKLHIPPQSENNFFPMQTLTKMMAIRNFKVSTGKHKKIGKKLRRQISKQVFFYYHTCINKTPAFYKNMRVSRWRNIQKLPKSPLFEAKI